MKIFRNTIMSVPGTYVMSRITKEEFCRFLTGVSPEEAITCYIGTKCRELIKKWTGVELTPCQKDILLEEAETILVMEMNFKAKVRDDTLFIPEFVFYNVQYNKEA